MTENLAVDGVEPNHHRVRCFVCGAIDPPGYWGEIRDRGQICAPCSARRTTDILARDGNTKHALLYLCKRNDSTWQITDFLSTRMFTVNEVREGCYVTVRFTDHQGKRWWGRKHGTDCDILTAKRLAE